MKANGSKSLNLPASSVIGKGTALFENRCRLLKDVFFDTCTAFLGSITDSPVEAVRTKAMTTLSLAGSSQNVMAAVTEVFVLQLIGQDLLWETWFVALH